MKPTINKLREEIENSSTMENIDVLDAKLEQAQEDKKMFEELIDEWYRENSNGLNHKYIFLLKQKLKEKIGE